MNLREPEILKFLTVELVALSKKIGQWMNGQRTHESLAFLKTPNNLVTHVDKESERMFVESLMRLVPEAGFIAEEGTGEAREGGLNWVIDPLDGTTNFVHSVPMWCTSVALCQGKDPILGVIYDPNSDSCFDAWKGGGARLNGTAIHVSEIGELKSSLLATGFPYHDFGREEEYLDLFQRLMHRSRGMRRLGSAALDMAWVACGRFEGFYEYGLQPWDIAAGAVIIREAGGLVTEFGGGPDPVFGRDLCCTNGSIHNELREVIGNYFQ